jgi:hypothetical protein
VENLEVLLGRKPVKQKLFKHKARKLTSSQRKFQRARQIKTYYKLKSTDEKFIMHALVHLSDAFVEKCAATSLELGRNPGAYFNKLVQDELQHKLC